jgi:hypothetical protein
MLCMAGGVEVSEFCFFSVVFPARCISSVSPRVYFRKHAFCFLPLVTILESPTMFSFLRSLHTVFHSGCTTLHSHQQCMRFSFSLLPCQHLLVVVFLIVAILTGVRCNFNVFDLHFLYSQGLWAFFHVSFSHLDFFLWKSSIQLPISLWGHLFWGSLIFWAPCIF